LTMFYIGSQNVWIDGSTQALAQRDASLLVDVMRRQVHEANAAFVTSTDANHDQLTLSYAGSTRVVDFWWSAADPRVHLRETIGGNVVEHGPVTDTPVTRFRLNTLSTTIVELTQLELTTANGDRVDMSTRFALLGG